MLSLSSSSFDSGILEESMEKMHLEETNTVTNIQQEYLLPEVSTKRSSLQSVSSGYGSEDDLDERKASDDTGNLSILGLNEAVAVSHFTKDSGLGEQSSVDSKNFRGEQRNISVISKENEDGISEREQLLLNTKELLGNSKSSEEPDVKYSVDSHSVDEVLSNILPSDVCKIDMTLEFDSNISKLSEENSDSDAQDFKYTEEMKTVCAGLDPGPLNITNLMDENYDELDNKIHCHRMSLEKIVSDILEMTKVAEDSMEDTKKRLASTFDEVLQFHQEVKVQDDNLLKDTFPEKNICDSEECPMAVRKPTETPSEFLNNVNSSVQFFHGLCSGYQAPSLRRYAFRNDNVLHSDQSRYSEWNSSSEHQASEPSFHSWIPSNFQFAEPNYPNLFAADSCGFKVQEKAPPPSWLNEELNLLPRLRARPSSEIRDEKLLETSCGNHSSRSSVNTSTPLEAFFNSLYLPEDLLPSEITSSTIAKKRRGSVDSLSDDYINTTWSSSSSEDRVNASSDDSVNAISSSSSECSLSTHSSNSHSEKVDTSEIYNTDIWGDEKETFWKPLPACPSTNVQRTSRIDVSRGRGRKFRSAPSNIRYASKPRGWSGYPPRKHQM